MLIGIGPRPRGRGDPGRHLRPGAGAGAGRGGRLVFRSGRGFAVGDAPGRRDQHRPGCRPWGARGVRGAHGGPVGAADRGQAGGLPPVVAVPRPGGAVVVCPVPVVVYRAVARAVPGLQHGGGVAAGRAPGCRGVGGGAGRCGGPPGESAHAVPGAEGIPQQRVVPVERADFGWQVVDAAGWPADRLEEAVGAAARRPFDLAAEMPLRARLSPSPTTSTCWWPWCTISPPMAGRSPRWRGIWGWPMPAGAPGRPRLGAVAGAVCRLHAVAACAVW